MITKIVEELKKSGHEINEETVRLVLEHASNMVELPTTESFIEQTKHNITLDLASGTYEMNVDSDGVKESISVKRIDIHPNYCGTAIIEMHNGVTFQCNACHQIASDGSETISAQLPIIHEGSSFNKDFLIKVG